MAAGDPARLPVGHFGVPESPRPCECKTAKKVTLIATVRTFAPHGRLTRTLAGSIGHS